MTHNMPLVPVRTGITAARIADVAADLVLSNILQRATTPPKKFDLSSDANCLEWFYSHIEHPPRPHMDPWDNITLDDIPTVDVTLPRKRNSSIALLDNLERLEPGEAKLLVSNALGLTDELVTGLETTEEVASKETSKKNQHIRVKKEMRTKRIHTRYPKKYTTSPETCRVANSVATLMKIRKLVRRRERHIRMLEEAVDLDWWRAISEEWKSILRVLTCEIVEHIEQWRHLIGKKKGERPWDPDNNMHVRDFRWKNVKNYLLKIPSDMDFMCRRSCYGAAQRRNPFLLPFPLEKLKGAPDIWSCRITKAANILIREESRHGTFFWDRKKKRLVAAPVTAVIATEAFRQSDFFKSQNVSGRPSFINRALRKGSGLHSRALVSSAIATRGGSRGTIDSFLSENGDLHGVFNNSALIPEMSRDIFTPGSLQARSPESKDDALKKVHTSLNVDVNLVGADSIAKHGVAQMRKSSLQLLPFNKEGNRKLRTVSMRPKGVRTPRNYDRENGFDILTYCPIQDCQVCEALRMERRLAVYTAKTERSQRLGLYDALMSSRDDLIRDVSATMIQGLWRGACVRQRIVRPSMYEDYKVKSDLSGTRMLHWLPRAHTLATRLQMTVRRALARWELHRRQRAKLEMIMAIRIQNCFRAHKARLHMSVLRAVRKLKEEEEYAAASQLQNLWRSHSTRNNYRKQLALKHAADRENVAAQTIQRAWRCHCSRIRVYLFRADIACRLLQRVWRGFISREHIEVNLEIILREKIELAPAFARLNQLHLSVKEAEDKDIQNVVASLLERVEQHESGIFKNGETESVASDTEGDEEMSVQDSILDDAKSSPTVVEISKSDVREMMRYFRQRNRLQPPTLTRSAVVLSKKLSDYEDRQICSRITLDDKANAYSSQDALSIATVSQLKDEILDLESFIARWKVAASAYYSIKRLKQRWMDREEIYTKSRHDMWKEEYSTIRQSMMPIPSSVCQREQNSRKMLAKLQYTYSRNYTVSTIKHDLYLLRRFLLSRRRLRDRRHKQKLQFASICATSWVKQASNKAEAMIRNENMEHDRAILEIEEPWIRAEDKRGYEMRDYLTATSFARMAVWEVFVTLFDEKSRAQLFTAKDRMKTKENDNEPKSKSQKLEKAREKQNPKASENESIEPSDEDAEVICENVTIDTKEFQEFTRRVGFPIVKPTKLVNALSYIDPRDSGRARFERVAYWYFSGATYEKDRQKSFLKQNAVMAGMFVKRKQELSKRWAALKWSRIPLIANRREKQEKRKAAAEYEKQRKIMEEEKARERLQEAILKEKEDAIAKKEKEYLDKVTYLNGLGDDLWKLAKSKPPFEKHFRPPAWSISLSEAMLDKGILPEHRAAFGVRKTHRSDEESDGESDISITIDDHDEEVSMDNVETTPIEVNADEIGSDNTTTNDNTLKSRKRRPKPTIFSTPFEGRARMPGNDMRMSYVLGQGISHDDLKDRSKKYRKELRKRKKKREKAEAKAKAKAERWAAMSPEERMNEQMQKSKKKDSKKGDNKKKQMRNMADRKKKQKSIGKRK